MFYFVPSPSSFLLCHILTLSYFYCFLAFFIPTHFSFISFTALFIFSIVFSYIICLIIFFFLIFFVFSFFVLLILLLLYLLLLLHLLLLLLLLLLSLSPPSSSSSSSSPFLPHFRLHLLLNLRLLLFIRLDLFLPPLLLLLLHFFPFSISFSSVFLTRFFSFSFNYVVIFNCIIFADYLSSSSLSFTFPCRSPIIIYSNLLIFISMNIKSF